MENEYLPEYFVKVFFHVGYVCDDPKACAAWYMENFGFEMFYDKVRTDLEICMIKGYGIILEFLSRGNQGHGGTFDHICFEVQSIEKMVEAMKEKGIRFEQEEPILREGMFARGYKWIYLRGPVGERIELFEFL